MLVGATTVALAVSGCSQNQGVVEIREAIRVSETEIGLGVGTCNAELSVDVEETESQIRVTVSYKDDTDDDCADGVLVRLNQALGDRELYDTVGEKIVVIAEPDGSGT